MDRKRIASSNARGGGAAADKRQRSVRPSRFVLFSAGSWKDLPAEIGAGFCDAFAAGRKFAEVVAAGCRLAVCFVHMLQIDAATGYKNSIAWFDDSGEFHFPIEPLEGPGSIDEVGRCSDCWSARQGSCGSSTDKAQSCITVEGGGGGEVDDVGSTKINRGVVSTKIKASSIGRNKGGKGGEVKNSPPPSAAAAATALAASSGGKLRPLPDGGEELSAVRAAFVAGLGKLAAGAEVTAVHKVGYDGPGGRARLEAFGKLGELTAKARGGDANVKTAWYGGGRAELMSIIKHGFGRPSDDSTYGLGIYLRPGELSRLSCIGADIDENGEQHVLLCRAILGKAELVQAGSKQFHPSSDLVDTGVDNLSTPRRYIVWSTQMNTHILPVYVASYKLTRKWQELLKTALVKEKETKPPAPKASMTVPMLFSVLKPEVSPSEMNLIEQGYSELKNGKLSREGFLKRVRMLIGDEKLKKIQEQVLGSSILCGFLICQSQSKLAQDRFRDNVKIEI